MKNSNEALTEQILFEFGFIKHEHFKRNNFRLYFDYDGYYVKFDGERIRINYLHELQNWYKLTQNEYL